MQFMMACGLDYSTANMSETEFYVSHECLLLDYEGALTRQDSTTGLWCAHCACRDDRQHSAHCDTVAYSARVALLERNFNTVHLPLVLAAALGL